MFLLLTLHLVFSPQSFLLYLLFSPQPILNKHRLLRPSDVAAASPRLNLFTLQRPFTRYSANRTPGTCVNRTPTILTAKSSPPTEPHKTPPPTSNLRLPLRLAAQINVLGLFNHGRHSVWVSQGQRLPAAQPLRAQRTVSSAPGLCCLPRAVSAAAPRRAADCSHGPANLNITDASRRHASSVCYQEKVLGRRQPPSQEAHHESLRSVQPAANKVRRPAALHTLHR